MNKKELDEIRAVTDKGNPGDPIGKSGDEMLERMNREHAPLTAWGLSFLDVESKNKILDIGCGGGAALERLLAENKTASFFGIDHSPLSVEKTSERNRDEVRRGRLSVAEGSVDALPYGSGFFDGIYTVESFYFWPDAVKSLSEVKRVLKSGGVFVLISEIYEHPDLSEIARENVAKYRMRNPTKEEFYSLFEEAGFGDIKIHIHPDEGWIAIEGR